MLKDNLKTLRRMTGLNQRQLADELGVSVKTVAIGRRVTANRP